MLSGCRPLTQQSRLSVRSSTPRVCSALKAGQTPRVTQRNTKARPIYPLALARDRGPAKGDGVDEDCRPILWPPLELMSEARVPLAPGKICPVTLALNGRAVSSARPKRPVPVTRIPVGASFPSQPLLGRSATSRKDSNSGKPSDCPGERRPLDSSRLKPAWIGFDPGPVLAGLRLPHPLFGSFWRFLGTV